MKRMMETRPHLETLEDYEISVQIHNRREPDHPSTAERSKHRREMLPADSYYDAYFVMRDGVEVGTAACLTPFWMISPGGLMIFWETEPELVGTEFERQVFEHLLQRTRSRNPKKIHTVTDSRYVFAHELLVDAGFEVRTRMVYSELCLQEFEPAKFDALLHRFTSEGLEIKSTQEFLDSGEDWKQPFLDFHNRVMKDVPFHLDVNDFTMEMLDHMLNTPDADHRSVFLARKDGQFVGVSGLDINVVNPKRASTGLTGVAREYRRTGLATALKATALSWAKAQGAEVVCTENEVTNPMLTLNYKLGFKDKREERFYDLDLS